MHTHACTYTHAHTALPPGGARRVCKAPPHLRAVTEVTVGSGAARPEPRLPASPPGPTLGLRTGARGPTAARAALRVEPPELRRRHRTERGGAGTQQGSEGAGHPAPL